MLELNQSILFQHYFLYGVAFLAVTISLVTDLRSRLIYNLVTLPSLLLGFGLHLAFWGWNAGLGMGLKWSLIGMLAGGLPFLVLNSIQSRAFGGGDVKLLAALGALFGAPMILQLLLRVAISGGIVALAVLILKGEVLSTLRRGLRRRAASKDMSEGSELEHKESDPKREDSLYIPYGVAIAVGTVWTLVEAFTL